MLFNLILGVSLSLSACMSVGSDYLTPQTNAPLRWNQLNQLAQPSTLATATGDISHWWQRLNDPLLSQLVTQALQSNLDLRSAQAQLRAARARRSVAAAERLPTVTGSGTGSRSESSAQSGSGAERELYSVGFDASWELDVFGGVRRSVEAADADLAASAASLHNIQVSLVAEIVSNYIEVRTGQLRLSIAHANLASQSETVQLTAWRAQAGLVSSQDVEQARSNWAQTKAQIPSLESSLFAAEHRLDILLGQPPGTLHLSLAAPADLPLFPEQIAVGIPADTLRQRPDVMAAERTLAAETARVAVTEAARYPSFQLSGSIGLEALSLSALDNSGASTSTLLGGITAPIFNAGRLRSQVEIQDAVREQAQVNYEKTVLSALQEVENALVDIVRTRERSAALTVATTAAHNAAEMSRQRYSAGLIDFQSVLDSERSVLSIEDSLASARADGLLALVRLYKALGGGWSPVSAAASAHKEMP